MANQDWMQDASLKDIDPSKLDFLQKLVFEMNGLSDKEKLPFLLALANRAKKENISFTQEEMESIIAVLKKHSTPEEVRRMDMMLQKFRSGK
ncbi:MAG: hypothetical protein J6K58_05810 [Lachnospiraceae bacterium]|nr:hypothetical protein [Lachnospiraceae bacterium]